MENHNGYQYQTGLNVLNRRFAHRGTCCAGGFYFTDSTSILNYLHFGSHLRVVELPLTHPKFKCVADGDKWRANMIVLKDKMNLNNLSTFDYLFTQHNFAYNRGLLIWASKQGYLEIVKYFVDNMYYQICQAELNDAMIRAAYDGHFAIVEYLVNNGAEVDDGNNSALKLAAENGNYAIVRFLVENGADHIIDLNNANLSCF